MMYVIRYFLITFFLCTLWVVSLPIVSAANLYVFYPTDIRPKSLQGKINALCPDINTVAFGRVVDFYRQIDQLPPNAILSLNPVVTRKQENNTSIKGSKDGLYEEEYLLISLDKPIDLADISKIKIGVLDILGRKPMKRFMKDLFDSNVQIKRVIKTEDFLPLLTFQLADAIFVSQTTYKKLQKKSKQKLIATKTGIYIGLAITDVYQQSNNEITQCIQKFDDQTNALLGVDNWELIP
ncbi:MAG: hypothetical protein OQL19_07000 [Gammaproteobacteria bacterium]|nr:hypothetical protein [Gammaproteobacteria bacterium]